MKTFVGLAKEFGSASLSIAHRLYNTEDEFIGSRRTKLDMDITERHESPEDAKRVDDLIAGFKNDENLRFAGIKDFWEKFLSGNISKDDLTFTGDAWEGVR